MKALKKCIGCEEHFIPSSNAQKYCTEGCRLKTYEKERQEKTEKYLKDKEELIIERRRRVWRDNLSREFEFFYNKIVRSCGLSGIGNFKKKCVENLLEIWEKIGKGTKYRAPYYLSPPFIYLFLKLNGIKVDKYEIMNSFFMNETDFRRGLMKIVPLYSDYVRRDKKRIVFHKITEVMGEFDFMYNLQFAKTSKQITTVFWSKLKNIREELIVGIVLLLTSVKMELDCGKFSRICGVVGINHSSVHNALNNHIFTKKNSERFRGLRKSSR